MNLVDTVYNYSFDSLLKYIKEKKEYERKKEKICLILML